jgi:hypothetical protein
MKKMLYRITLLSFILLVLAAPALAAGDDVPAWLQQVAATKNPAYDKDVPAVVLHDEASVAIGEDGKITTTLNFAIRILTREGRRLAVATEHYQTDSGKVREMKAWLIRPTGDVKKYGKDETLDFASAPNDVYNEARYKLISASDDADAGAVFGYQTITEERSYFNQTIWSFQVRLPVMGSRYTLTLPANWKASSVTFNHAKVEPVVAGSTYMWELRNLAPIEPEPSSPEVTNLAPRIAVSYYPMEGARANGSRTFDNWSEVSRWYTELNDAQDAPSEALVAKAKQLTSGAKTELEKIRAIAKYAQELQYISIQIGTGRYRAHSATDVFTKSYGDCKDKANLMRAMLKAVNIPSYLVLIFSGDSTFVREEWASPSWFNHCIIAVKVSEETQTATVLTHPSLGRLLIFDATDDMTPVGDLPDYEQGSFALIAAGENGSLVRMPTTPPESNSIDRRSEVELSPEGAITATVSENAIGQIAADYRRTFRKLSRPEYTDVIERWIARGANGAKVSKINPTDNNVEGRFGLDLEFIAGAYAQVMHDRLLVFRPAIIERRNSISLVEAKRKHPVVLESEAYNETVRIKLPGGFEVDEMPENMKLDASFGTFSATYEVKDGHLLFTRKLVQHAMTVPVEDYAKVKQFFAGIRAAEQSPVVLSRK